MSERRMRTLGGHEGREESLRISDRPAVGSVGRRLTRPLSDGRLLSTYWSRGREIWWMWPIGPDFSRMRRPDRVLTPLEIATKLRQPSGALLGPYGQIKRECAQVARARHLVEGYAIG